METKDDYISIVQFCSHYNVDESFIHELNEEGLIEIIILENKTFIHQQKINDLEKMIRIHHELSINIEGVDVVFNLLQKMDDLQSELIATQNRLKLYENEEDV